MALAQARKEKAQLQDALIEFHEYVADLTKVNNICLDLHHLEHEDVIAQLRGMSLGSNESVPAPLAIPRSFSQDEAARYADKMDEDHLSINSASAGKKVNAYQHNRRLTVRAYFEYISMGFPDNDARDSSLFVWPRAKRPAKRRQLQR